ncbi:MAG TPA: ATP-grasp domain-containing protein [Haloplasmataceae bacterium]
MKAIIFIGTQKSGSSREAIKAAKDLGFFTILLTNNKKQIEQREEYTDVHHMIYCDLNNLKTLKTIIQSLMLKAFVIRGIVSFVDSYVHTACILGDIFKVNHFTTNGVHNIENKLLSRECLRNTDYVPDYMIIPPNMAYNRQKVNDFLPAVLKSPRSTGSKDVYKVDNYAEFSEKLIILRSQNPHQSFILEKYLPGKQYLVETLVIKDKVHIIAIIEQEIEFINQHFIVTGYSVIIEPDKEFYQQLEKVVEHIIRLHGLRNGSCHLELRYNEGIWKLIEINPRISGGGMNQLVKAAYGIDFVKEIIKHSLNERPDIIPKFKKEVFIQYVTIDKEGILEKVTGKKRAIKHKGVLKVYIKPRKGNFLSPPKSLGNRYAYVLATGDSQVEAKENAKRAIKEISFILKDA